jgi:hypothetical protein
MGLGTKHGEHAAPEDKRPLHTIALEATKGLEVSKKGIVLKTDTAAKIKEQLVLALGTPDLDWAVRSLLILAARLEKRNGKEAANGLIKVACAATTALSKQAAENTETVARLAAKRNSQFLGTRQSKQAAPMFEKRKANGLVINQLMQKPRRA